MLVAVKAMWGSKPSRDGRVSQPRRERLKRLARSLDALALKDEVLLRKGREIAALRCEAALELHSVCARFVRELNGLLARFELEFQPAEYEAENFQEEGVNLFQINARGRILQITFQAPPELVSTEDFRVPYILAGAVRCFNQQLLEKELVEEQMLFYTLERSRRMWRFFEGRTHRSGPFDAEYLISLMEQLV